MGFKNHELFIKRHQARFRGPFLEIGAKDYGSTVYLRAMFPGETLVGTDMANNIARLLAPGATLSVSVPYAWRLHGYPSDYRRLTPDGAKRQFPGQLSLLGAPGLIAGQTRHRYQMPPTCIEMIGSAPGTPWLDA